MYQNKEINKDEFTKRLSLLSKNQLDELITIAQRKGISQADIQAGLKSIQQLLAKEKKNVGRCMKEAFVEEFDEWCDSLMRKIDKYELIEEKTKEEE